MALTKVSNTMLVQPVNHNILINPAFTVFQRAGTTKSGEWGVDHENSNSAFGPDRWRFRSLSAVGGNKVESSTKADDFTGVNKLLVKNLNATDAGYVYQRIEAVNLQGMYGKEMTFSFGYSDTGGSGIPRVQIASWDSSDTVKTLYEEIPTSLGNNRWTCTVTLSTTDGTIPDPSKEGLQVTIYPNEKNTAPAEWSVWETKLEVGSVATPFIARSYGEELALCQRYYQNIFFSPRAAAAGGPGSMPSVAFTFMTLMRASPTGTIDIASNSGSTPTVGGFRPSSGYAVSTVNGTVDWTGTVQLDAEL